MQVINYTVFQKICTCKRLLFFFETLYFFTFTYHYKSAAEIMLKFDSAPAVVFHFLENNCSLTVIQRATESL